MSNPPIRIQLLGGFSMAAGGRPMLSGLAQNRKLQQLLQYLLLNCDRAVTHQELIAHFWGDSFDAEASLRAVMYRLRQTIDREEPALANCIRTGRGSYRWNPALACSIDVQELQRASAAAAAAAPPQQDELEQAVIALYKGRLLPEAAGELWVDRRQVELQALYKTALYHQIERARVRGDLSAAELLSRRGLQMDAADERLYIEQILCLQALERPQEAAAAAGRARALGFLHTGIPGLSDLESSHQRLIRAQAAMQREAAHIEEEIRLGGAGSGAFICSYAAFRCISQVRLRASTRYHHPLLVAIVSLVPPVARPVSGRTAAAMQVLEGVLLRTLNTGDVAARYSENRFVLLLSGFAADGSGPMERVRSEFYRHPGQDGYLLLYQLHTPHPN